MLPTNAPVAHPAFAKRFWRGSTCVHASGGCPVKAVRAEGRVQGATDRALSKTCAPSAQASSRGVVFRSYP